MTGPLPLYKTYRFFAQQQGFSFSTNCRTQVAYLCLLLMHPEREQEKKQAATEAVKMVSDHQVIGLGTGSSAFYAIQEIATRVKQGLIIQAVPTSLHTAQLAHSLGIPLMDIHLVDHIDITIDGADEFTSGLQLVKGGGGALLREKLVASMSETNIIIADSSKLVDQLGKFGIPLAVTPFAWTYVISQLRKLKGAGQLRRASGQVFLTDDGNYIVDAQFGMIEEPIRLSRQLNEIEGIAAHGLFTDLASAVIMGTGNGTRIFTS